MNRFLISGFCFGLAFAAQSPSLAQQTQQTRPLNDAQLRQEFRSGYLRGCQGSAISGVRNKTQYCTCLADAYNGRYNGATLAAISQFAASAGNNGATLVNLMMQPETQRCQAGSQ
jgi:hypothetical protein